ncbi:hypothetical protein ACFLTO_04720 [Chloroflexota bacterium]
MSYTIEEIERDWNATSSFPEIVLDAFERAEKILGREWVDATRKIPGGQVNGPGPLLSVVSMGGRLTTLDAIEGATKLVAKLKKHDVSAEAELTAMHLLYVRNKAAKIKYEPDVGNQKKADFSIRIADEDSTYVEVTRPDVSEVRERLTSILESVTSLVRGIKRQFALEVYFRREPEDEEIKGLTGHIQQFCAEGTNKRQEVDDLALLILSDMTPGQVTPYQEPGAHVTPRLGAAQFVFGRDEPKRHVVASAPYADKRADAFLRKEATQLDRRYPGLIMVDVSGEPTAFSSWGVILARRFQPGIHTRVSGVCLFAPQLLQVGSNLIWVPNVKLHINPHASYALPRWIADSLKDAANDFGTLLRATGATSQ